MKRRIPGTSLLPAVVLLVLGLLANPAAMACAVCFGRSDSPLAQGMNMGILTLLGVVVGVLGAFVVFFVFLGRRAANTPQPPSPPPEGLAADL